MTTQIQPATRLEELRRALQQADDGAFLVEARVIRRLIREIVGFSKLAVRIPHPESLIVRRSLVTQMVHADELGLDSFNDLPSDLLLISEPEESALEEESLQELLLELRQQLFHGQIDRFLRKALRDETLNDAAVRSYIDRIGQVEFDEIHAVLIAEGRLLAPQSRAEAFCEFCATLLSQHFFHPDHMTIWFPSLVDPESVVATIGELIPIAEIFARTALYGAADPDLTPDILHDERSLSAERRDQTLSAARPSQRRYRRLLRRAARYGDSGNSVSAAVSTARAVQAAVNDSDRESAKELVESHIDTLVSRLQAALSFSERDVEYWRQAMMGLAEYSTRDFWSADKRLLFDLQKVCLDHERVVYSVDLVKWVVSLGRRPLRRPLVNLREVMMAKHLKSAASRLVSVRLPSALRDRLTDLLRDAADLAETQMRHRMRPLLRQTLLEVGLTPRNVPERVAFDKLIEESLDCIADRGYLTMGYLRDSISRNNLKLPDLTDPRDLIRGDLLLRSDKRLDVALDGVYRRGEFYLRWMQILSSLAFGTRVGRFATLFLVLPFGGATVIVEGAKHLRELLPGAHSEGGRDVALAAERIASVAGTGLSTGQPSTADSPSGGDSIAQSVAESASSVADSASSAIEQIAAERLALLMPVIVLGMVLLALIHVPSFRTFLWHLIRGGFRLLRNVLVKLPLLIVRYPVVRRFLRSRLFVTLRRYFLTPVLITGILFVALPWLFGLNVLNRWWLFGIATLTSAAINSRLGRDVQELSLEWMGSMWHRVTAQFAMAVFDWIMDVFKAMLEFVERFIYAVDEWLRFRSGETFLTLSAKALLGVVWGFIVFLIRIYVNLLIEPQVNPIKHFPVVTVAHKITLPLAYELGPRLTNLAAPFVGIGLAGTIVGFTLFLFPGFFGFLVWELKENWRLYSANRQPNLHPVIVGNHGETMLRLMKPGFHSGTLPKLFRRMRSLTRKKPSYSRFVSRRSLHEQLLEIEKDVTRFMERELLALLSHCPGWEELKLSCRKARAASNTIHVSIISPEFPDSEVVILLQEQSGWAVAFVQDTGWLPKLSPEMRNAFANALMGTYRFGGIEIAREQIEQFLPKNAAWDISDEGVIIWPDKSFEQQVSYDLATEGRLRPRPAGLALRHSLPATDASQLVFAATKTAWTDWLDTWRTTEPSSSQVDRSSSGLTTRPQQHVLFVEQSEVP